MSKIRVSEIRVSKIRGSKIRESEIRVSEIRVSEIRISSNHRELHGAIFCAVILLRNQALKVPSWRITPVTKMFHQSWVSSSPIDAKEVKLSQTFCGVLCAHQQIITHEIWLEKH